VTETQHRDKEHRAILPSLAHRAMIVNALLPDFFAEALAKLGKSRAAAATNGEPDGLEHRMRDLRDLLWVSIDNGDSRDLNQLTVAEALTGDTVKILVPCRM
jgi:exoribonuclease R